MSRPGSVLVVGGGVFGTSTAIELRQRGFQVVLADPGPLPHPNASSTDLSKAVRMDYGCDEFYADLAAEAIEGWRAWNRGWSRALYREVGILMVTPEPMAPGGFEADSFEMMRERGVPVERVDSALLSRRFPAWRSAAYVDGYFNPQAGWVDSGEVMATLIQQARDAGVSVRDGASLERLTETENRVSGAILDPGGELRADHVVLAAGAWSPMLMPHLRPMMRAVGQPVVHLEPVDPEPFVGERFPVWCADIASTGWYGFPLSTAGTVKLGNHGPGRQIGPGDPLEVLPEESERAVEFARTVFPDLADAPLRSSRLCLYCDTWDSNFLIDHDPERPGLIVAAGGSGHGFKFAPLLGQLVADVLEGKDNDRARRFAWRGPGDPQVEQARNRP